MSYIFAPLLNNIGIKLQAWVRGYLILPDVEPSIVILGVWNTKDENDVLVNHVVLLFKYFIYKNRTNKHAIIFML